MKNSATLIAIGYWRGPLEPDLPDPSQWQDATWSWAEQQQVLTYLRQGRRLMEWMGYSWCRFACGISEASMGTSDVTDGTYIWPEALPHYLECHQVRLPAAFVEHVLQQSCFPQATAQRVDEMANEDYEWWRQTKPGLPLAT